RLQLEHHQCPGRVLGQGLVDPQPDLRARLHAALDQVILDELLRGGACQSVPLLTIRVPVRDLPGSIGIMCSLPRLPYMHLDGILGRDALRGTTWSVRVRRGGTDGVVAEHEPGRRLRTASVGKILLLLEVASRIGEGSLSPVAPLSRRSVPWVADSGL